MAPAVAVAGGRRPGRGGARAVAGPRRRPPGLRGTPPPGRRRSGWRSRRPAAAALLAGALLFTGVRPADRRLRLGGRRRGGPGLGGPARAPAARPGHLPRLRRLRRSPSPSTPPCSTRGGRCSGRSSPRRPPSPWRPRPRRCRRRAWASATSSCSGCSAWCWAGSAGASSSPGSSSAWSPAAVVSLVLLATRRAGWRTALPFGPPLLAGAVLALALGGPVPLG